VAKLAEREGISVNRFIALAVAQKVSALNARAWLMRRKGGEPPRDDRK
jgi:hypothetical protein